MTFMSFLWTLKRQKFPKQNKKAVTTKGKFDKLGYIKIKEFPFMNGYH